MSASKKIKYIYNEEGKKTDVLIPMSQYKQMMEELEDLEDLRAVEEAKSYKGKTLTLAEMKKRHLKKNV